MRSGLLIVSLILCSSSLLPSLTLGDETGVEFFEKKIRPALVQHCYKCHSSDSSKIGGKLLLDNRAGLLKGGEGGPAILPEHPEASLLVKAIHYDDEALQMPPAGKLPPEVIADFEEWIRRGAPDPREGDTTTQEKGWEAILAERSQWWSLQPVKNSLPPSVQRESWSEHPVDRFILSALEQQGLSPSEEADPRTLARRLSLVLTGLPPTEKQSLELEQAAVANRAGIPTPAIEHLVDELLASPHFGERWARHWLDIVRFSETHGNEWNYEVHHAWRYRDYLIRALNQDVPYNQLVREHIAGDLLENARWNPDEKLNESIIGTSFYRFGEGNHDDCIGLPQLGYDLVDNQIDTLSKAFQATTIACARCHDHKLDAISMNDYYGLLGILRSSRQVSHTIDSPEVNRGQIEQLSHLKPQIRQELKSLWQREADLLSRYLLASRAHHLNNPQAAELSSGLDQHRLEKWTQILKGDKLPTEHPLSLWQELVTQTKNDDSQTPTHWKSLCEASLKEQESRSSFNQQGFILFADFRQAATSEWQVGGLGFRNGGSPAGDLILNPTGEEIVSSIHPAGFFTNSLSDKLNGTLRSSPLLPVKKYLSFLVSGQRSSALRLVSNNCQLNYKNYKALISRDWNWITFEIPENAKELRVYAELMTMFDNPKFPDQLSALGGDKENYKLPWEKAAENPRSWFGIVRVVQHDKPEPPKMELDHLLPLCVSTPANNEQISDLSGVANLYAATIRQLLERWGTTEFTDADSVWLDSLLQKGLLPQRFDQTESLKALTTEYRRIEETLSLPRIIPGLADCGTGFDQNILIRGDCLRPGEVVTRHYPAVLTRNHQSLSITGSGRRELAEFIASPHNPLTARVMVNRIWQHLFGTGLVRTVDDFGHVGELPSHPELLDYLATRFVNEGWSIKRLIRTLVLTRTFQESHRPLQVNGSKDPRLIDPHNRLLHSYPARRMEAEAVRDQILATSGGLDPQLYGMSIPPWRETENADRRLFPGPLDGAGRRSIYIKNNLMEAPHFLSAFNFPGGKVTQGRRDRSNVPAQALTLLNDPFVFQQAEAWSKKLVSDSSKNIPDRIREMFVTALNRPPTENERLRFESGITEFAALSQIPPQEILQNVPLWKDVAHTIFNLSEFIFIP